MRLRPKPQTPTHRREMAIIQRPIESLIIDGENARSHPEPQLRALGRAIQTFEVVTPILIDRDLKVLAGHARMEACKRLGWAQIPTISVEHLTPAKARAFALADNRISELGKWNERQLALQLHALAQIDLDFSLEDTGFSMGEIDLKIEGLEDQDLGTPDPDDSPPPVGISVCRPGDVWILGDHRIICAGALDAEGYGRVLGDDRVAAAFCDPPYNVPINGHVSGKGKRKHREFAFAVGEMAGPEFTVFLASACRLAAEHSHDSSVHFWCTDWRHIEHLLAAGRAPYDVLLNICVWAKNNGGMGSLYRSAHEFVAVFRKGAASHRNNVQLGAYGRNRTNVWNYPGANTFLRSSEEGDLLAQHPTPKPVQLVADALLDVTARGDLVLDSFLGSGTTLIACERIGRRCRGIELDPLYIDLTIRRWQRLTGEAAALQATGETFDALAACAQAAQ